MKKLAAVTAFFLMTMAAAWAQQESNLKSEFRREFQSFGDCFHAKFGGCAETLVMGKPLHLSLGSIAPQNGFALGPAFSHEVNKPSVRFKINSDAVVSTNQSWRAGFYLKAIPTNWFWTGNTQPVLNFYSQATSLNQLFFFGLGPNTLKANRSLYGMTETVSGANAIIPTKSPFSFYGEFNVRTVDIRGRHGQSSPSIEALFNDASAPGLSTQPTYVQLGERLRFKPKLPHRITLDYSAMLQHYHAVSNSQFSFRRFTLDFNHQIPLRKKDAPSQGNFASSRGPDEITENAKPDIKDFSWNTVGSLGFRTLIVGSVASNGSVVPFYFQPTLGGTDINGEHLLPSYSDYRFRAPNLFLMRGTFEHSLPWVLGVIGMADFGKVAETRSDINFSHLRHSYSAGLTVRAGNLPQLYLLFAWGGNEGSHVIGYINPALLGGSPRPSLY